jgi:hypothetical protein
LIDRTLPWSAAWTPALARIEVQLVNTTDAGALWDVLAPLIVQFAAEGLLPEMDIRFRSPQKIYWGNIKLAEADRIVSHSTGAAATVSLYRLGGSTIVLSLEQSSSGLWAAENAQNVPIAWLGQYPIPLYAGDKVMRYPLPKGRSVLKDAVEHIQPIFTEASELLSEYSSAFLPWVANVIRNVVPLDASDGIRMSASVEEFPALTFLSFPGPAVEIAETLVHEASHHNYFALQRLAPLHDGSDKKEYYSPIKDRGRTIDLILFAFHAFGNAALFHRDLRRAGGSRYDTLNGRTLDVSLARLRVLHTHLGETRALTEMGETLWRPLADPLFG